MGQPAEAVVQPSPSHDAPTEVSTEAKPAESAAELVAVEARPDAEPAGKATATPEPEPEKAAEPERARSVSGVVDAMAEALELTASEQAFFEAGAELDSITESSAAASVDFSDLDPPDHEPPRGFWARLLRHSS